MTLQKKNLVEIIEQVAEDAFNLKVGDVIHDYNFKGDIIDFEIVGVEDPDIPLYKIKVTHSSNNKEYQNTYYDGEEIYS